VSRRGSSSHSGFACEPPSASTTTTALCSLIQPARVSTSAGSRCHIHWSICSGSQRTGANPRLLGECHHIRHLTSSDEAGSDLVSPGEVCPMVVQMLDDYGEDLPTAIVSVAYLALQTCFRTTIASTYQLALGQAVTVAAIEVYCVKVRPAQ